MVCRGTESQKINGSKAFIFPDDNSLKILFILNKQSVLHLGEAAWQHILQHNCPVISTPMKEIRKCIKMCSSRKGRDTPKHRSQQWVTWCIDTRPCPIVMKLRRIWTLKVWRKLTSKEKKKSAKPMKYSPLRSLKPTMHSGTKITEWSSLHCPSATCL